MYQTFNMGMGFAIVVSKGEVNETMKILKKHAESKVKIVGEIKKGKGAEFQKLGLKF